MRLSVCTIALNEQDLIGGMLHSVAGLADEVVIGIDGHTTDATADVVAEHGGRTFPFMWSDDFSAARNLSLDIATGDWVLVIDPDERLTEAGRLIVGDLLKRVSANPQVADGFSFLAAQCNMQGAVQVVAKTSVRLFRLDPALRYRGVVHEEVWVDHRPGRWLHVEGVPVIAHCGYSPERWVGRGKHELYLRLLERRVAEDPTDEYAQFKLAQTRAMDASGMVLA